MDEYNEYLSEVKKERNEIESEYQSLNKKLPKPKFAKDDLLIVNDDWYEYYNGKVGKVTRNIQLRRTLDDERGIAYVYKLHFEGHNGALPIQKNSLQLYDGIKYNDIRGL